MFNRNRTDFSSISAIQGLRTWFLVKVKGVYMSKPNRTGSAYVSQTTVLNLGIMSKRNANLVYSEQNPNKLRNINISECRSITYSSINVRKTTKTDSNKRNETRNCKSNPDLNKYPRSERINSVLHCMFMNISKENGGIPRSVTIRSRSTPGRTGSARTRLELGSNSALLRSLLLCSRPLLCSPER